MDIFLEKHQESILGVIEGFDRIIFKGHLTSMFPDGADRGVRSFFFPRRTISAVLLFASGWAKSEGAACSRAITGKKKDLTPRPCKTLFALLTGAG